jgi:hypothetical protein
MEMNVSEATVGLDILKKDSAIGYDMVETDVQKTRAVTVQCNGKRFRILMELSKGCYGNCSGCSLSTTERKSPQGLDFEKIKKHLWAWLPHIQSNPELRTTVVNYGVGDYFLFDAVDLECLSWITREFFDALPTQRNVISMSTSLLTKAHKMEDKVKAIQKHLHPTQVVFDAVIDPERLTEHGESYRENLAGLTSKFPFVDVVVNAHQGLTEHMAKQVHAFASDAKVLNLDIQYAVHKDNLYRVRVDAEAFTPFWSALWTAFHQNESQEKITLSVAKPVVDEGMSLVDLISRQVEDSIQERVLVQDDGRVFMDGFGFGDVLLDERYEAPHIGIIEEGVFKANRTGVNKLKAMLYRVAQGRECQSCQHQKKCYGTGFGWYQKHAPNVHECHNPAKVWFETLDKKKDLR